MANKFTLDLSTATGAGYFTVTKGETTGDATYISTTDYAKITDKSKVTQLATVAVSNDVYTLNYNGATAIEIAPMSAVRTTWNIRTGAGSDSIDASKFASGSTVNAGNGDNSIVGGVNTTITTGTGRDTITAGAGDTIKSGAGNDSIIIGTATDVVVDAGEGKDTITAAGNGASIAAGNGDDVIDLASGATNATVNAGAGNDSIRVATTGNQIALGAGTDTVSLGATATATLSDYAFGTDVIQAANAGSFLTAVAGLNATGTADTASKLFGTSGTVSLASANTLTVDKTNGFYAVEITDATGTTPTTQGYAWGTEDGGTINASSYKKAAIIVGTNNGDNGDYITGTSKNDTIFAGAYDSVYGGKGNDSIFVQGDYAVVGLADDGSTDTVTANASLTGFDEEDLTVYYAGDVSKAKVSLGASASTTVTMKNGKSTLLVSDSNIKGNSAKVKVTNGSTTYNVQVIRDGAGTTGAELDNSATAIFASQSTDALIVTDDNLDTVIDLGNTGKYGDTRYYSGVRTVNASGSNSDIVLIGSASKGDTLTAGSGASSLYGGGYSQDSLISGDTGANVFFYGDGDGRDTIANYKYNADDEANSDKISFLTSDFSKITRTDDSTVKVTFGSGTNNTLTINTKSGYDTAIAYSVDGTDHKAKVGVNSTANTFTYDSTVDYYQGGTASDTVSVSGEDDAEIWLDGSKGVTYDSVENVDASSAQGAVTLAGGSGANLLTAGSGDASLWGGNGGNDTLVGGTGANTFFFGKNNGSDVVSSSSSTDVTDRVMLYDVVLSDVKSYAENSAGAMVITLNDGSSLTYTSGLKDSTVFELSDGSEWTYNTTEKTWAQA